MKYVLLGLCLAGCASTGARSTADVNRRYVKEFSRRVRKHFFVPDTFRHDRRSVEVGVKLSSEGGLREVAVRRSSGDSGFDQMVVEAVRRAAPLPKPPPDLADQEVILHMVGAG